MVRSAFVQAILNHSEAFVGSFTEDLLAYGVGRVLDYQDMPTVRSIGRDAARTTIVFRHLFWVS